MASLHLVCRGIAARVSEVTVNRQHKNVFLESVAEVGTFILHLMKNRFVAEGVKSLAATRSEFTRAV